MKVILLLAVLLSLGVTQDQPRYSCPEYDVDFEGHELAQIPNTESWEDCGKPRTHN